MRHRSRSVRRLFILFFTVDALNDTVLFYIEQVKVVKSCSVRLGANNSVVAPETRA